MKKPDAIPMTFRIPADLAKRLEKATTATKRQPYPPTKTQIVVRGLADELERIESTPTFPLLTWKNLKKEIL